MTHSELFQKNLQRWGKFCPTNISKIENCTDEALASDTLESQEEANECFSGLPLKTVQVIYVFGLGHGYYYQAAQQWLKENENHFLVFLETNPQIIRHFLETELASSLLYNHQAFIYLIEEGESNIPHLEKIAKLYAPREFFITTLKNTPNLYTELKAKLSFFATMNRFALMEYRNFGTTIFKNFFQNYLDLAKAFSANSLIGKFKDIPAIICGAGPSLDKNIELLAKLGDRALIFAGGTALNALNAQGVMPHFGAGIDPNFTQFVRLVMNHAYELPFFYRSRMFNQALEMVHGDKLFVPGTSGYGVSKVLEEHFDFPPAPFIDEGFNVINFSLSLAHAMGCNPIICVGVDLAYTRGDSYAAGIISHPIHDRKEDFRTKIAEEDLLTKDDIDGVPVFTLWKWISESMWYSLFSSKHPEITLINSTEGGIGFLNVPNIPLREVCDKYLNKQYDFLALRHGEIQNSPLPKKITNANMRAFMQQLAESLQACIQIYDDIIAQLTQLLAPTNVSEDTSTPQIKELEKTIEQHIPYKAFLEIFNDIYNRKEQLELQRLELDKEDLPQDVIKRKRILHEIRRNDYLKKTAQANSSLINHLLEVNFESQALIENWNHEINHIEYLKKQYPLPLPNPNDQYAFDNHTLSINDSESDIHFHEIFAPQEHEIQRTYYPSGALKQENFYQQGYIHGPSSFFNENGSLLCKSWFWQGQRQGKMWTYYPNGEVHSLQRFLNNQWHGLQQFHYQNGLPKSIFTYVNGLLHGDVRLFHPSGQLARLLHFVNGQRQGLEQIWDERGQIRVEANYSQNRPIGIAKSWHRNGVLESEIKYDELFQRINKKTWNEAGVPITEEEKQNDDYFDRVTDQVEKLTFSLDDMISKATDTLPLLMQKEMQPELATDFEKLAKEIEHLHSLNKLLQNQSHPTDENAKEALWKNPVVQQEMERRLNNMGKQVNDDLKTIEKDLSFILQHMLKKPKDL